MDSLPVIFRADRSGKFKGDVTAVFPTIPADRHNMTCYAHIGQHSACSMQWYRSTRPATRAEYADLLEELRRIYEQSEDPVKLKVCRRISSAMRAEFRKESRR